ncbi:MAG: hypothetical protein IH586_22220, partial [Anaerolineaceae bacterium]|nr:hypothetical protein [Anaerolineaceae bacterium]
YAFSGPGIANISLDKGWMGSIRELSNQSAGDVDFPPALQWARRAPWFSLQNLVLWGLGAPLALLAWAGFFVFAWAAYRRVREQGWASLLGPDWSGGLLVWLWTAVYFTWQSSAWNPTMRYQLPIYPTLAILAAWGVGFGWSQAKRFSPRHPIRWKIQVGVMSALVLILTLTWAFAFTRIYTRTETRVAASRWIFENVPGPVNLVVDTQSEGSIKQMVSIPERAMVRDGMPFSTTFDTAQAGVLSSVLLPSTQMSSTVAQNIHLRASVFLASQPGIALAQGDINIPLGTYEKLEVPLTSSAGLEAGQRYVLVLETDPQDSAANNSDAVFSAVQLSGQLGVRLYGRVQQRITQVPAEQNSETPLTTLLLDQDGTLRQLRLADGATGPIRLVVLTSNQLTGEQQSSRASRMGDAVYTLDTPLSFSAGVSYLAAVAADNPSETLDPTQPVQLDFLDDPTSLILPAFAPLARVDDPLFLQFSAQTGGQLSQITFAYAAQVDPSAGGVPVVIELVNQSNPGKRLAQTEVVIEPAEGKDPRGKEYTIQFDPPVELRAGQLYNLTLTPSGPGAVAVRGSAPANETDWDMGLPFRTAGYDPFGGIYRGDLNFQMYWDDNEEKYQRFTGILDNADYIFMSSNRQWGTTTRLPERHPLTTELYRALLGCPEDKEVIWCYNVAEPGSFQG